MWDGKLICPDCGNEASERLEYIDSEDVFRYTIRCFSCGKVGSITYEKTDIVEYMGRGYGRW